MSLLQLQRNLALLGMYPAHLLDGQYGKKTAAAVTTFLDCYPTASRNYVLQASIEAVKQMSPTGTESTVEYLVRLSRVFRLSLPQTAYVLGTVEHETAGTMRPVEEAFWLPVDARKRYLASKQYGKLYYGRGFVQITWKRNYELYAKLLNIPLDVHPEFALNPCIAGIIAVHGMVTGAFTGKPLSRYINSHATSYVKARRVVNGDDDADVVASLARKWEMQLRPSFNN